MLCQWTDGIAAYDGLDVFLAGEIEFRPHELVA